MLKQLKKELSRLGYGISYFDAYGKKSKKLDLPLDPVTWTEKVRWLNGKKFSFDKREYLKPIYRDKSKEIFIVKARQMEITEYLLNWLLYNLTTNSSTVGLYLTDRWKHASIFSKLRLYSKGIEQSETLKSLVKKGTLSWLPFKNGSRLCIASAWHDFEEARSIPADFVVIDEVQSTNMEAFPVVKETLAKSSFGRLVVCGTGSDEGDQWWKWWHSGNQQEWDPIQQKWIPKNPTSSISSYHITQNMASWITA